MAGKLPIDRVRENEDAPATYELEKERLARQRAAERQQEAPRGPAGESPATRDAVRAAEGGQAEAAAEREQEDSRA